MESNTEEAHANGFTSVKNVVWELDESQHF